MCRRGAHLATERSEVERSGAKWRGRGLGLRNTGFELNLQYKTEKKATVLKKVASKTRHPFLCCAARGHALAVCHLLALLVRQTSSARRNNNCQKFKKAISLAKAPSHEKHFASLDVRGLWHARPPPSIPPFTSHGLRPRNKNILFQYIMLNLKTGLNNQPCQPGDTITHFRSVRKFAL